MKRFITSITVFSFFVLIFTSNVYSLDVKPAPVDYSKIKTNDSPVWGNDVLIMDSEPEGPISGVRASNGTIWVAVNDTTLSAGRGLLFYTSTNDGNTWALHPTAIQPAFIASEIHMVKAGDSTICFFRTGTTIYRFNVVTNSFLALPEASVGPFGVVSSSTNSLYIFFQSAVNSIRRTGSADYGFTWGNGGLVTSNTRPTLSISSLGDTLVTMYRLAGNTSAITRFRYRETAPGVLATAGASIAVLTAGTERDQYNYYMFGAVHWVIYTEGVTPNRDIKALVSTNSGLNFGSPIDVAINPNRDEFWFAGGIGMGMSFNGLDLTWLSDSAGTTAAADRLFYRGTDFASPNSFDNPFGLNQNPVTGSDTRDYKPSVIELPNADLGVIFVATQGGNKKLFWDRFSSVTNITNNSSTAESYNLSQNYPNPFNPTTKIDFTIPNNEFVSIKVFDVLGKEVATLVNKKMDKGSYSVSFNASKLTSGVYFYKIVSGNFSSVKRMMLVK